MNKTDVLIIGAGPTGLFCAHQLGIIGLSCEIVDNLDKAGGQCIELYPDKPIYDIPAVPECTGEELTNNLLEQIKPFNVKFHLNERVEELKKIDSRWHVKTSGKQEFDVASIVIAGGVGSFEPRKFPLKESERFEGSSLFYSIKDKTIFKDKTISTLDVSIFKSPKLKRNFPKSIDSNLVTKALFSLIDKKNDAWINLRDRAVMLLLYGAGLRISEALSLKKKEAPRGDWLRVLGKGNKYRDVPLLPVICDCLLYTSPSPRD